MVAKDEDDAHQQRHARCRHAALEDGKESHAVRGGSDAAATFASGALVSHGGRVSRKGTKMAKFERETYNINGVKTVVYSAGHGEPVVFFHGGGTVDGFDFAEPWTSKYRVIAPYHPGFGESGDDPMLSSLHDYVMHYLELFDVLKLDRFNLVGLS